MDNFFDISGKYLQLEKKMFFLYFKYSCHRLCANIKQLLHNSLLYIWLKEFYSHYGIQILTTIVSLMALLDLGW